MGNFFTKQTGKNEVNETLIRAAKKIARDIEIRDARKLLAYEVNIATMNTALQQSFTATIAEKMKQSVPLSQPEEDNPLFSPRGK